VGERGKEGRREKKEWIKWRRIRTKKRGKKALEEQQNRGLRKGENGWTRERKNLERVGGIPRCPIRGFEWDKGPQRSGNGDNGPGFLIREETRKKIGVKGNGILEGPNCCQEESPQGDQNSGKKKKKGKKAKN